MIKTTKSFADSVANSATKTKAPEAADFRAIMNEQRNLDLNEINEKKSRATNVIFHGVEEPENSDKDVAKKFNDDYVQDFLKQIGVNATCKSIYRLGKTEATKKRPIKLVTASEGERDEIMKNLNKLKDNEKYRGVSITEDYTIDERNLIRSKAEEAKANNAKEPVDSMFTWKVRGTPKNGLFIKKVKKPVKNPVAEVPLEH